MILLSSHVREARACMHATRITTTHQSHTHKEGVSLMSPVPSVIVPSPRAAVSRLSWLYPPASPPPEREPGRITFLSPGDRAGHVESVRGWRQQQRAERDAGIVSSMSQVLIPFFRCTLCGICIGPGYYEQELYVYPVAPGATICLRDDAMHTFTDGVWLLVCGGCARHRRRGIPEFFRVVDASCWTTNRLIAREGERVRSPCIRTEVSLLRAAITQYVLARLQYLISLLALSIGGSALLHPLLPLLHLLTSLPMEPGAGGREEERTNTHRASPLSQGEEEEGSLLLSHVLLQKKRQVREHPARHLHPQVIRRRQGQKRLVADTTPSPLAS